MFVRWHHGLKTFSAKKILMEVRTHWNLVHIQRGMVHNYVE